jgi:hypothetical protein
MTVRRGAALVAILAGTAHADTPRVAPAAIELDRDERVPASTELGFDGGEPLAGWIATLGATWLERPAGPVIDGARLAAVRRRETLAAGGAVALGEAVVVDARLAGSHQIGDRLRGAGDPARLDRFVLGDLRFGARLRVAPGIYARVELALPTGADGEFAGDAATSVAGRLIGRATLRGIVLAGSAGLRVRGAEVVAGDRLIGNEVLLAGGVVAPLWRDRLSLAGELVAAIGDDIGAARGPSPIEARLGVVVRPAPWLAIALRGGRGLGDEIGAPRALIAIDVAIRGRAALID